MRTERRWGLRKSVLADVVIDNQPAGLARGRIANVSVGGLFVHTADAAPEPRSHVELVLLRQTGAGTRVYRIPTTVVRTANKGVGLVVNHYDLDTFRTLVALLLDSDSSPTADAPNHNPGDDRQRPNPELAGTAGTAEVAVARVVPSSPNASPNSGDF
jgi:hypothetical protein